MITEAMIGNYKGIKSCKIRDLSRVNLFIGKNDSCKSSILEAIYHTCREFVGPHLSNAITRRTNVFTGGRELWYRYNTRAAINVTLQFPDSCISLDVRMQEPNIFARLKFGKNITALATHSQVVAAVYNASDLTLNTREPRHGPVVHEFGQYLSSPEKEKLSRYVEDSFLIDCRSKLDISYVEDRLGRIKLDGKDKEFGSILNNVYGRGEEWEFLPHPDRPAEKKVAIVEGGRRLFLSDVGDGFRYGLAMCATAMTLEGTGIFIEEIENHQHSGSLKQLVRGLVDISRDNDLQLFITTHSDDVWNSFARVVYLDDAEREKEEFRCFLVERDAESGVVTAEATDDVQKITKALGQT